MRGRWASFLAPWHLHDAGFPPQLPASGRTGRRSRPTCALPAVAMRSVTVGARPPPLVKCVMANTLPPAADPGHRRRARVCRVMGGGRRSTQRRWCLLMDRVRNTVRLIWSADADDLAQIALMEVLRSLHTHRRGGLGHGRTGRRALRACPTAKRVRCAGRDAEARRGRPGRGWGGPSGPVGDRRRRRDRRVALQELSEHKRMTVVLFFVHGYSVQRSG